ncbi:DUF4139 domain-containing protein [Marinoscillum furvescens]|uniref:Uncharacterized protein (TIGR02231 family) n=1 Tax=Marinoscillum furvescens DSM 4134 TaxID=1122208 RepID=A0A3D9L4M9_MARFU|nr:DUF4139 domain-containing protein [Marinoscillum furvescens]RED98966.1 uncharacterized protein (TIGR02231 family) [Marinoscillum furvescens DSM 4134]
MKNLFLFVALFGLTLVHGQKNLKTEIKEVTVFLNGAQVSRTGAMDLPKGKFILLVDKLSPYIDEKSIQVKSPPGVTILSVKGQQDYLTEQSQQDDALKYSKQIEQLEAELDKLHGRKDVLKRKSDLLLANQVLGGEQSGPSIAELRQAVAFYDEQLTLINEEMLQIVNEVEEKESRIEVLNQQLAVFRSSGKSIGQILMEVETTRAVNATFELSYIVANAGWFPSYDVRVQDIEQPLKLTYKASVYQNTGVDWDQVKLRFSNGDPNKSGVIPELSTWNLNYARYTRSTNSNKSLGLIDRVSGVVMDEESGESLPGANVVVQGTTVGTVTDLEGRFDLTLPAGATALEVSYIGYTQQTIPIQSRTVNVRLAPDVTELQEVVVSGYASSALAGRVSGVQIGKNYGSQKKVEKIPITYTVENQTTVEFEVKKPYSLKSNNSKLTVELTAYDVEADYQYIVVPKVDTDVFLQARILDWNQYNLLQGEANLYFEDAYVGRTILEGNAVDDTLDISLGRDQSIVVRRNKVKEYSKKRVIGNNTEETRRFEILVKNNKSKAVKILVKDQLPVSVNNNVEVEVLNHKGATHEEATGKLVWNFELKAGDQKELEFGYQVKYPKREQVILE